MYPAFHHSCRETTHLVELDMSAKNDQESQTSNAVRPDVLGTRNQRSVRIQNSVHIQHSVDFSVEDFDALLAASSEHRVENFAALEQQANIALVDTASD